MKYYLIVGEASGDLHASHLMSALKTADPQADFRFFGGDLMAAVGGKMVKHYKELAYMGFIPVLLHLRTIFANMKRCKEDIHLILTATSLSVVPCDYPLRGNRTLVHLQLIRLQSYALAQRKASLFLRP